MNLHAIRAIYLFEMARTLRTFLQSIVVAGHLDLALFRRVRLRHRLAHEEIDGVTYGAFIVPGLIMLSLLTESISNASFGIYFPKFTGTIYELLSAPISLSRDRDRLRRGRRNQVDHARPDHPRDGRVFVPLQIAHPFWMVLFLVLTAVTFSLFGFIIGIWANGFEKLQLMPMLIVTPLTFLGGSFYSIDMLPPVWRTITLFNPVVYLISGFRWSFFGIADVRRRRQPRHDAGVPRRLPRHRRLDIQDRVQAEELDGRAAARSRSLRSRSILHTRRDLAKEAAHWRLGLPGRFRFKIHSRPAPAADSPARLPSHGAHRDEIRRDVRRRHQPHPQCRAPRQTRGRCRPRGRGRGLGDGRQDQRAGRLGARSCRRCTTRANMTPWSPPASR